MGSHRVRLGGVEYLFCDPRQPAPERGRALSPRELQALLAAQGSSPRLHAVLREFEGPRAEQLRHRGGRGRGHASRPPERLRCYEIEVAPPRITRVAIDGPREAPQHFEPSPMFDEQTHWIEIQIVGEDDAILPWMLCEITLPSGKVVRRRTDRHGLVRVEGIAMPGACQLSMPELDESAWEPA